MINQARQLLKPNGIFYALEPCNQMIQFYPPKPTMTAWMQKWDESAMKYGLNPYIGIEVGSEMITAGFNQVQSNFFPVSAFGNDREKYFSIINNLQGFYMGEAPIKQFQLGHLIQEKKMAILELNKFENNSFVLDALFSVWGKT